MNEFKSVTFSDIEKQIHYARLARSAALGETIGNMLGGLWFSVQRLATRRQLLIGAKYAALRRQTVARQHLASQRRVPMPH